MTIITVVLFVAGIALLIWGADLLVRGAAHLAAAAGVPRLIIGLTVVALGTSAPELAVSLQASQTGQADLVLGNVVGSNIANVLLILGLAALVAPLLIAPQLLQREVPAMIGVSALLWLLALDGAIGRFDGALLVTLLCAFIVASIRTAKGAGQSALPPADTTAPARRDLSSLGYNLALVVGGLVLLVAGANWLVDGAVEFARALGASELIIGLTIVALGTSLPEIATSVLAGLRGERDIAVGNVVGSNILNILCALGLTALLAPRPIAVPPAALAFDLPVMFAAALACLPIFFNGKLIARWEGALFLAYYLAYTVLLILAATGSSAARIFSAAMIFFAIPLTVLTLVVVTYQNLRQSRRTA